MAGRTPLTVTSLNRTALTNFSVTPTADVTNGNVCTNDGATFLVLFNNDAVTPHNVTIQVASGVDGLTTGPRSYVVPVSGSGSQVTGVFPIQFYGSQLLINADNANVRIQPYSVLGP